MEKRILRTLALGAALGPRLSVCGRPVAPVLSIALATFNRYRLTPDLLQGDEKAIGVLKSTVMLELCLIIMAIILTSIVTTAFGPPDTAFMHDHPSWRT